MPPEHPKKKGTSFLYELLRPELVKSNSVPLNPDGFSNFLTPGKKKTKKTRKNRKKEGKKKRINDQKSKNNLNA